MNKVSICVQEIEDYHCRVLSHVTGRRHCLGDLDTSITDLAPRMK